MTTTRTLLMLLALGLPLSTQAADIYRYKDAAGNWQYSDKPVPGAQRVGPLVRSTPANGSTDKAAAQTAGSTSAATDKISQKVQQDVAKVRAEHCKKATEAYEQSISTARLYKAGANGEPEYLDADQIDAYRAAAHTEMDKLCGK